MKPTHLVALIAVAASATLVACSNDRGAKLTIGSDACGHFADGPIETATAGAGSGTAADVSMQHTRYDLTLVNDTSSRGGFVKVTIAAAGDYTFLFDAAVTIVMTDAADATVNPAASATHDADCATIGTEDTYTLAAGTYTLRFFTASADPLLMVWMHQATAD